MTGAGVRLRSSLPSRAISISSRWCARCAARSSRISASNATAPSNGTMAISSWRPRGDRLRRSSATGLDPWPQAPEEPRMRNDRVAVAVSGAGFISNYHINGLKAVRHADIVAVADPNGERAEASARSHGIKAASNDYRRLLDSHDVHAVVISTPDNTHEEVALAAIDAGKSVL